MSAPALTDRADLIASPALHDPSALDPRVEAMLEERDLTWSWQPFDPQVLPLLQQKGLWPLSPERIREWDPELADSLFTRRPGVRGMTVEDGMIRLSDTVLMVFHAADREAQLAADRARRERLDAKPKTELEQIEEKLRELGVPVPHGRGARDEGKGVKTYGYSSASEAAHQGVRRSAADPVADPAPKRGPGRPPKKRGPGRPRKNAR